MRESKSDLHPESLMMTYGYQPELSHGAIKSPIFQTSSFIFASAEEGKAFFEAAYDLCDSDSQQKPGLIYSRLNNPNLEILEDRLCLWDKAEACAVFESGMAAISTVFLEFLKPGDLLLYSSPCYGGTDHFIHHVLSRYGVDSMGFHPGMNRKEIMEQVEASGKADRLAMIYVETPANPTNALFDFQCCAQVAKHFSTDEKQIVVAADNTYMGPLWQQPLLHGVDLVLYSATKYIGGHSDVIAGACLGSVDLLTRVKNLRTYLGNMAAPWTAWMLMRSLETLKVRMEQQARNAAKVAEYLQQHPKVDHVYYLGLVTEHQRPDYEIFKRQCKSAGAMMAFDIQGGEKAAFRFLNALKLITLAVSLGSTESLAEHPATMTHADVSPEVKNRMSITENLVRLSIGVEHIDDLTADISQALEHA